MLEIRAEFRTYEAWSAWLEQHRTALGAWRRALIDDIERFGIIEPISGAHFPPHKIAINRKNLRETVTAGATNSRKRAGLLALQFAHRRLSAEHRQRIRLLSAEAITRVARILQDAFPNFVGAEYLPTDDEKQQYYPIPHLDLTNAAFPDAAFDLFYSSDVLEHVSDLSRAFAEIARLLDAGGILVSTFPFEPHNTMTERRASLDPTGKVVHHVAPEYHSNPMRPSEGSLVFSVPGWDVLELAKRAGFADAKMTLVLSSTYGVAALPGIFVMTAIKKAEGRPVTRLADEAFEYQGPRLRRLIGLIGLARSGTTMLCSMLGVHSQIAAVYEPFNANKKQELPPRLGIDRFFAEFPTQMNQKEILLVKETGTQLAFLDRTADLLRSVAPPLTTDLIVLLRNPLHCFLSMLDGRKKWWGGPHEVSVETFQAWALQNLRALTKLLEIAREFNAVLVSYERMVEDPAGLFPQLMRELGLSFEERQLSFEKHVDRRQVRGDVTIATDPFPVSGERARQRALELAAVVDRIKEVDRFSRVNAAAELIMGFGDTGIARTASPAATGFIRSLADVCGIDRSPAS